MTQTEKQPTCEERVSAEWQSTRDDLSVLYGFADDDETAEFLEREGYSGGDEDEDEDEFLYEARSNYGLSFDYVEPNTFDDQDEGYFRYQFSWGGPSDELRFYVSFGGSCHHIEYWFMDWYDGASRNVTCDEVAQAVFDDFEGMGMIQVPEEI